MKITIKTLDQKSFTLTVDDKATILDVKKAVFDEKKEANLESSITKLIWKGKILKNDQTLEGAKIDEKGFFVVMPGKVAAAAKKPVAAVQETPKTSKPKTEEVKKDVAAKPVVNQSSSTPVSAPATNTQTPAPTRPAAVPQMPQIAIDLNQMLNSIPVSDDMIATVAGFGFPMEKSKLALQIANNNPDVAVELLFSNGLEAAMEGMKRKLLSEAQALAQQLAANGGEMNAENLAQAVEQMNTQSDNQNSNEATPSSETATSLANNPLAYLLNNESFKKMIQAIGENPESLPQIMQGIRQANPDLFQQIQNNHAAFLQLINSDTTGGASSQSTTSQNQAPVAAGQAAPAAANQGQQGVQIAITPAEREAINRLMALGFSEMEAVQAYMACDKNEEYAANFLFDNM